MGKKNKLNVVILYQVIFVASDEYIRRAFCTIFRYCTVFIGITDNICPTLIRIRNNCLFIVPKLSTKTNLGLMFEFGYCYHKKGFVIKLCVLLKLKNSTITFIFKC